MDGMERLTTPELLGLVERTVGLEDGADEAPRLLIPPPGRERVLCVLDCCANKDTLRDMITQAIIKNLMATPLRGLLYPKKLVIGNMLL